MNKVNMNRRIQTELSVLESIKRMADTMKGMAEQFQAIAFTLESIILEQEESKEVQ